MGLFQYILKKYFFGLIMLFFLGANTMNSFGQRIKQARMLKQLTQTELGKLVGVKPQIIQYLESDKAKRSLYTLTIAKECGVNPYWLEKGIVDIYSDIAFNYPAKKLVKQPLIDSLLTRVAKLEKYNNTR